MKELRYEIINSVHGLIERYIIVHDDGKEELKGEKKLDTSDMLGVFNKRLSNTTHEIKRRR